MTKTAGKPQQPKRGRDDTRTPRQMQYLDRLEAGKGKRLLVDIDAEARGSLETLLGNAYGGTQREVVERALNEAAMREQRKKKA